MNWERNDEALNRVRDGNACVFLPLLDEGTEPYLRAGVAKMADLHGATVALSAYRDALRHLTGCGRGSNRTAPGAGASEGRE